MIIYVREATKSICGLLNQAGEKRTHEGKPEEDSDQDPGLVLGHCPADVEACKHGAFVFAGEKGRDAPAICRVLIPVSIKELALLSPGKENVE